MIRLFLLACVLCMARGQYVPLIIAAPSAVSHQSRIDIRHSPGYVAAPVVYSPIVYPSPAEAARDSIFAPVIKTDQLLTPVAFTFFHNLPLARALERPVSIDKIREETNAVENTYIAEKGDNKHEEMMTEDPDTPEDDEMEINYDTVHVYEESKSVPEQFKQVIQKKQTHE